MLLSQSAQYALRAVIALARAEQGGLVPVQALARRARVPRAYLSKIMRQLVDAGLVGARPGKHGGYWFAGEHRHVRVADVLRAVGAFEAKGSCVLGQTRCDASRPCLMHGAWSTMQAAYNQWANSTTIADILVVGHELHPSSENA